MTLAHASEVDALIRRVAAGQDGDQHELGELILDRLRATVPEFFSDDDVAFDMAAAVAANVRRLHRLLAGAPGTTRVDALPLEAGDLLHSTLQHGIPLISLLEAYRSAQGLATDWWQRRIEREASPALLPAATRILQQKVVSYIDAAATEIRTSYELERRALENSPEGRRAHLVRTLLSGEAIDADAASRTLNHPLTGRHVALVLWRAGDGGDDGGGDGALGAALEPIAAALAPARLLTTAARHRMYAWLSTHGDLDPGPAMAVRTPPDVRAAMSGVHAGVDGFVRAHVDASRTAAIVRERGQAGDDGRIAVFERFELLSLLSHDAADCKRFVHRVLGPLAADTPQAARARETLYVYLASGSSPSRAAERLGVHRNTVSYRLQTVADLLGALERPEEEWAVQASRRLEVEVALLLVLQFGPSV